MFVKFYVPSKDSQGQALADNERNSALESVAIAMSMKFGGATATDGQGYYITKAGQLIAEDIKILASYTDAIDDSIRAEIRAIARIVKVNLRQESIMLEFGDAAEFI